MGKGLCGKIWVPMSVGFVSVERQTDLPSSQTHRWKARDHVLHETGMACRSNPYNLIPSPHYIEDVISRSDGAQRRYRFKRRTQVAYLEDTNRTNGQNWHIYPKNLRVHCQKNKVLFLLSTAHVWNITGCLARHVTFGLVPDQTGLPNGCFWMLEKNREICSWGEKNNQGWLRW